MGTQVNVLTMATNVVQDYTFVFDVIAERPTTLLMSPRGGHVYNVLVTSHGSNSICTWQYYSGDLNNQSWTSEYGYIAL